VIALGIAHAYTVQDTIAERVIFAACRPWPASNQDQHGKWWPSNTWPIPRTERHGGQLSDRPFILHIEPSSPSTRFYVYHPGLLHCGAYTSTLAEACGVFDRRLGFGAARVAFALSHRPTAKGWVRR
jgi:hypothetical protein